MKIIDLTPEYEPLFFLCLEDWSDEIKEAGNHKEHWYQQMKSKGFHAKLALDDSGIVGGMIQYAPIESSFIHGKDLYVIYCIWVHGHKKGRGNFQNKGFGTALLEAAEEDVKRQGAKGIVAWGLSIPVWMKASWFKKHGYKKIDKDGMQVLLWKKFSDDAEPPGWMRQKKKPEWNVNQVTVTSFINGWCPAQNVVHERAKRASKEFGNNVILHEIHTCSKEVMHEWGISDALFIDRKQMRTGPPPKYEKIKKQIQKKVIRLQ